MRISWLVGLMIRGHWMEIRKMQRMSTKTIEKRNEKRGLEHNKDTVFPHLIEEIGELAREINCHIDDRKGEPNHEHLAEEMADVLAQLFNLANDYDIDLEEAFLKKTEKLKVEFESE